MHQFAINPGNAINTFILPFVFTDKVKEAVESIWKNHSPLEHRLILIDNSSEDFEDRQWLEENSHLYIRSYRNLGPAMAFNLGIKIAKTKFITVFSDDARIIDKTWFIDAAARLEVFEHKAISSFDVSQGLIISANSIHPQDLPEANFYDFDINYTSQDYQDLDRRFGGRHGGFGLACAISTKKSWIKAGMFDEEKYIYYIDGAFVSQAQAKEIDCYYGGVVFHYGDASHKGKLVEEGKYQDTGKMDGEVIL